MMIPKYYRVDIARGKYARLSQWLAIEVQEKKSELNGKFWANLTRQMLEEPGRLGRGTAVTEGSKGRADHLELQGCIADVG